MAFDPLTLVTASLLLLSVISGLLLLAWLQNREARALVWWSASFLLAAIGFILLLMGASSAQNLSREIANAVVATGYGVSYGASRRFNDRHTSWIVIGSGGIAWLFACWIIGISPPERMTFASLLVGGYTFATAYELWFGARERLLSQRAAAIVCGLHGLYFVMRLVSGPTLPRSVPWVENVDSAWATVMAVETLLYATSFGFLVMSMAREKVEKRHRQTARLDPLTGVTNRRAFQDEATRLFERNRAEGRNRVATSGAPNRPTADRAAALAA